MASLSAGAAAELGLYLRKPCSPPVELSWLDGKSTLPALEGRPDVETPVPGCVERPEAKGEGFSLRATSSAGVPVGPLREAPSCILLEVVLRPGKELGALTEDALEAMSPVIEVALDAVAARVEEPLVATSEGGPLLALRSSSSSRAASLASSSSPERLAASLSFASSVYYELFALIASPVCVTYSNCI